MPDNLSPDLTQRLIQVLDCTLTLHRSSDDRSTAVGIAVTTAWDPDSASAADRDLLARHLHGQPDSEGWHTAPVVTLYGHRLDLADPDPIEQADEISALTLSIAEALHTDHDTVLALERRLVRTLRCIAVGPSIAGPDRGHRLRALEPAHLPAR